MARTGTRRRINARLIQRVTDAAASFQKPGDAVTPLHARQDAVGPALQANVKVWANTRLAGHDADQVVARLGRFQTAETDADVSRQASESLNMEPSTSGLRLEARQEVTGP